jgi:hypothetical protein
MIINTREDLDTLSGTDEYVIFIDKLKGSLFNVRKDDVLGKWVADESNELIEQYGFTRADFDPIVQPTLPVYTPDNSAALRLAEEASIARRKAMLLGFDYNGNQISVTTEDGNGMVQVKTSFDRGLADTTIHFKNGTKLYIAASDFGAFAQVFITERNKFF